MHNVLNFSLQYAQWSAIFFAIKSGNLKAVDFLLDHKAKTDLKDEVSVYDCVSTIFNSTHTRACSMATPLSAGPGVCPYRRRCINIL